VKGHIFRYGFILFWTAPLLFLGLFFYYPLAAVFRVAWQTPGLEGISYDLIERVWNPLAFTIYQAGLSTLLTLVIGLPAAFLFARFDFPIKSILRVLVLLPFILPTVVVAASLNALLGPRGWVNLFLMSAFQFENPPIQMIHFLPVILLAHVFYNTTIIIRVVGSAWEQLNPRLEEAARVLGASPGKVWWEVTRPLLQPAILAAVLLVFLFDFTSFGVILMLGGPRFTTLEVEIYIQALQMLNMPLAGVLSAVQLVCTLAIMGLYTFFIRNTPGGLIPRLLGEGLRRPRNWKEKIFTSMMVVLLLILFVSPLAALGMRSLSRLEADRGERGDVRAGLTLEYYQELFINRRQSLFYVPPLAAIQNSLAYASLTVVFSLSLGLSTAYAMRKTTAINRLADPLLMLPLGASAVTLGLGYILVFNRPPLDVRSFPMLVPVAHSLVAFPFVLRTMQPALLSIPENLRQAAAVMGASPLRVWWEVDRPILAKAALVSAIFSFTISLGEFGATTFLARPEYPTMPVAIFRFLAQPGAMNYGQAMAMATLLLLVCGLSIYLLEKL
jgi:thiamine transport system permease protein